MVVKWTGFRISTNWTVLAEEINATKEFNAFHWENDYLVPEVVLSTLENQKPDCKLYYTIPFRDRDVCLDHSGDTDRRAPLPERRNILGHPNLYALKAVISYGGLPNDNDMALVQQILEASPNLRELDLKLSWGGFEVAWNQSYAFNFTESKTNFSPLTSLILDGYNLGDKNRLPGSVIDWIGIPQIRAWGGVEEHFVKRDYSQLPQNTRINLDAWLEKMDWSYLTNLELQRTSPAILQKLSPVLTNLTSFSIQYGKKDCLGDFLTSIKRSLESISIRKAIFTGLDQFVSDIVVHHGSALKSLTFLGSQFDISHMTEIRERCLYLETINLNAQRLYQPSDDYDAWTFDYTFMDNLVSIPSLKNLSIRFESASGVNDAVTPDVFGDFDSRV